MSKVTISVIQEKMLKKERITMLTSYDYSMASLVEAAGIDMILVGDSLGNVVLGYKDTLAVTVDDIIHHTRAVVRATDKTMVVADMPFLSYHISYEEAVRNAGRLIQEGGAQAVKIEGGTERVETVKAIIDAQIPVMGHIGLTPQSVNQFGGFKVQGKDEKRAKKLIEDAIELEKAGVFGIVLEGIPEKLAKIITEKLTIPTIGIGAGSECDGQVLVVNDMLGMFDNFVPKFVKQYANLKDNITNGVKTYIKEVKNKDFPKKEHTFSIDDDVLNKLY